MEFIKLQLGCLAILVYVGIWYMRDCRLFNQSLRGEFFYKLLLMSAVCVIFDAATSYTTNHLHLIEPQVNLFMHALFLVSIDSVLMVFTLYMLVTSGTYPKTMLSKVLMYVPFIVTVVFMMVNLDSIRFVRGVSGYYAVGVSVYACIALASVYVVITCICIAKKWQYFENHKRAGIVTYIAIIILFGSVQITKPELLLNSLGVTLLTVGVYINLEDPNIKELGRHNSEAVMSLANLIENRDTNTGEHVKRTSIYVEYIATGLRDIGAYNTILTDDYITNLVKAAPMHDIGKVSVPDAILQKPARLTDDEFEIIKLHAEKGSQIVMETFRNLGSEEYRKMAFEVARYHHEQWNGGGYPEGLRKEEIPLSARIMAVADVFDALSDNRCYREAMPIDECFKVIEEGRGEHFDPTIVDVFLNMRPKVEKVYNKIYSVSGYAV